jgi:lysyl-tRNA synthetase class 1
LDDEALQSMVFAVGKEHGFEPLRDWFKALYEVLLGAATAGRALADFHRALRRDAVILR